jgi:catechol 2,3-dioxygenase-like lactoylglutathione lyase family enzyme
MNGPPTQPEELMHPKLELSRPLRFNHVGISVPDDLLDEKHRDLIGRFYTDVFGFLPLDMMTIDRKRYVLQAHTIEQFVFIHAEDEPMRAPRLDHFGLSVAQESELDEMLARAKAWREQDDRVDIIDKKTEDHGVLAITSFYVRYLLPMMVEIQFWDYK